MTDHAFPEAWRRGLYETITRRRDMRSFFPDPIPAEILMRILSAVLRATSTAPRSSCQKSSSSLSQG